MKDIKYLAGYLIPLTAIIAILHPENLAFLTVAFSFGLLPLLELLLPRDASNFDDNTEQIRLNEARFDWMLWLSFPIQWGILLFFLVQTKTHEFTPIQLLGISLGVGVCSGVLGINAAHELGHRSNRFEQFLAQGLLLSSLYMHFFVEHNRGHHKYVATPLDPASARLNEPVYFFVYRSISLSYVSAWKIQKSLLEKAGISFFHYKNNMLVYTLLQVGLCLGVWMYGGWLSLILFLGTAITGIILLEVINYIEHYGMQRRMTSAGIYEKVLPKHSWNANYPIGRIMLFELTRHADHHYKASRKYQILRHWEESPELPAGYPSMMILSLFPPLWFRVMNPKAARFRPQQSSSDIA